MHRWLQVHYKILWTMKYGEHLRNSIAPEYGSEPYLDYEKLDGIIRSLSEKAPARYGRETKARSDRACIYCTVGGVSRERLLLFSLLRLECISLSHFLKVILTTIMPILTHCISFYLFQYKQGRLDESPCVPLRASSYQRSRSAPT